MWSLLAIGALLVQQAPERPAGSAATRPLPALELTLAAPVDMPDGRRLGATVTVTSGADPWFVFTTSDLCQSDVTRGAAPAAATEAWRVSVTERSRTTNQITVAVSWARIFERGRPVTSGSSGSSEMTLQVGDRIPIDRITRPSQGSACPATQKSLELRLGFRSERVTAGQQVPTPFPDAALTSPVLAELWMVHVVPGKGEVVERQVVRLAPGGTGFFFRGLPVESTAGPMVLELSGRLRAVTRPDGTRALWTGLTRSVTSHVTGRVHSNTGTGEKTVDWPATTHVVSFDLPDPVAYAVAAGGGAIVGGTGGGGGGGRGGAIAAGGGIANTGGGAGGAGGALVTRSSSTPPGPNLLEGHRLSLRVRVIEDK